MGAHINYSSYAREGKIQHLDMVVVTVLGLAKIKPQTEQSVDHWLRETDLMNSSEWVYVLINTCHIPFPSVSCVDPSPRIVIAVKKTVTFKHTPSIVIF